MIRRDGGLRITVRLYARPDGDPEDPFLEFRCFRPGLFREVQRLLRVFKVSEFLPLAEEIRQNPEVLQLGAHWREALGSEQVYRVANWVAERVARPRGVSGEEPSDWTEAHAQMRRYALHLGDPDVRDQVQALVSVAYRDRLEAPEDFVGQETGDVLRAFTEVINNYQAHVRRAEEAFAQDPGALADSLNALGTACLAQVRRALAPPTEGLA